MKRLVKLSMCFLLMLGVSSIQEVSAEEPTTYTGDAEGDVSNDIPTYPGILTDDVKIKMNNSRNSEIETISLNDLGNIYFTLLFPNGETIMPSAYDLYIESSNESLYDPETLKSFNYHELEIHGWKTSYSSDIKRTTSIRPLKEGKSLITISLKNKESNEISYRGSVNLNISDQYKDVNLFTDTTELNLRNEDFVYFPSNDSNAKFPNYYGSINLGFKDKDNNVMFDRSCLDITSTNENIVQLGHPVTVDRTKPIFKIWEEKGYIAKSKSNYIEAYELLYAMLKDEIDNGNTGEGGMASDNGFAIIPRNTGTAYVTFSYGTQSVTVKVNVTNLTDEPSETLPSDLSKEFFSDANEKVNVNLSKADTVSSDIFTSALESGKEVTFNILGENNRTQYAWTFNGATITNPDIDLNLSLVFTSDLKDKIENLAVDKNILYLTFAHHGDLPGIAKMKVDVSSQYKDGDEIYLYYYNEETGKAEQTGDKVIVKDGYAEFEISHCSTYFFTSESIETGDKVETTTPNTDNNVKSDEKVDVKEKADVKKDSSAIKDTGLDTATTTKGIAISILACAILAYVVIAKRKKA